ncbi:hypothetical protein F4604DRAFT_847908 [Suillus subluteus]|nr:hypothetical protein F4604DRAFT_847908 [Suillus subluteus]
MYGKRYWQRRYGGPDLPSSDYSGCHPLPTIVSSWEQKREPPTKAYQYLIVAAEPYETIAFRIPACEIEDEADEAGYWNWSYWDPDIN